MKRYKNTKYLITDDGKVYSESRKKFLTLTERKQDGYIQVTIYEDGKQYTKRVHRLVAEVYLSNPNNLSEIDHIDGDKSNNHIDNLEWVTRNENMRRAFDNGLIPNRNRKISFELSDAQREYLMNHL